jgi:hypothetical protein
MRFALLLSASLPVCITGCSAVVAGTGIRLDDLKSRDAVHAKFGEPIRSIQPNETTTTDEFVTRKKIGDWLASHGCVLGFGITWGLSEFYAFPYYSFCEAHHLIAGQRLQFTYDVMGNVITVKRNGKHIAGRYIPDETESSK